MVFLAIEEEEQCLIIHQILEEDFEAELCRKRLLCLEKVEEILLQLELFVRSNERGFISLPQQDVGMEEEHIAKDKQIPLPLLDDDSMLITEYFLKSLLVNYQLLSSLFEHF